MAADKVLYRFRLEGYWADIGQPKDFLRGTALFLARLASHPSEKDTPKLARGEGISGSVLIDSSAKIGKDCLIGPNVTIGTSCTIGDGVRISNSAIMDGVKIGSHSYINGSIVGWQSSLGRWVSKQLSHSNCTGELAVLIFFRFAWKV